MHTKSRKIWTMDKAQMERIMVGEHAEVQYTLLLELVAEGPQNKSFEYRRQSQIAAYLHPAPSPCTFPLHLELQF